ncbi:PD-(D/E)XK nuclease family protein [Acidothermaceae bacterium B102]|nr:PD-(D/E)XK nuclease family protein [Acidothermaceae bacterium B102]
MEQLGLEGMPTRLYSCTPSRLTSWLDCPRRYRLTYLDRPQPAKGPPWAHNSVGASVHNALARWWSLARPDRTPASAGRLLDTGWIGEGFRDDGQSDRARHRARDLVEGYVATLDPDDEPVGCERTVGVRTESLAVSGRVDRIDRRASADGSGDELVIVDYKTGRRPMSADDARSSLALALYALAAARTLRTRSRRVELHHLPTGEVHVHEHSADSLARHLDRAASIALDASAADTAWRGGLSSRLADKPPDTEDAAVDEAFPPRPSALCGWCDFSRHCPTGRAAAAPQQSWAALGEDDR